MEEIYYKKNLEDLTNRQLDLDYQNLFIENRLENYPEELEEHHEILHNADPQDRVEPAESRTLIFNYIRDFLGNRQAKARRRLRGGKKSKRSRKSKKSRRRKNKKTRRTRRR
jgi:hypothetical protein